MEFQAMERELAELHRRMRDLIAGSISHVGTPFTRLVSGAIKELGKDGRSFSARDIAAHLSVSDPYKLRQVPVYLSRLFRKDEIVRVQGMKGRYRLK
jgi:hypothetical protein